MKTVSALAKKAAIVTGAAGGIGRAIVEVLVANGFRVLAVDKSDIGLRVFEECEPVLTLSIDIAHDGAAEQIVAKCADTFGSINLVVNNAGFLVPQSLEVIEDAAWDESLAVNTTAVMRISRAAVPHLKNVDGGRIVNIGSTSSAFAAPDHASYCASKHALAGLSKAMAFDLGRYGITVNYIMPGFVATPMAINNYDSETIDAWKRGTALGRVGEPKDIAAVVLFLASDAASYITGAGIPVDGGHSLNE